MKILHTSDWHLGHRLHEQSQYNEQKKFLDWLIQYIDAEKIDVLLVSGDIFDTAHPSTQSLELFYRFLAKLHRYTSCNNIIMTAGNHDAPGTLNAPAQFTRFFNIHLIGKATGNPEDEIIEINIHGEKLVVAAVPFLRDRDIRRAIAGENATEMQNRYRTALTNHYNELAEFINNKYDTDKIFSIAMGHLFATGAQTSDSEKRIYVGGLGDISAEDFPNTFNYIALGHLHRPQQIGGKEYIRYSGTPYPLSFSEAGSEKKIILINTGKNQAAKIDEIKVPAFRKLCRISGNLENIYQKLEDIALKNNEYETWVEVNLNDERPLRNAYTLINEHIKDLPIKALSVRNLQAQKQVDITRIEAEDRKLTELQPDEVFQKKCKEQGFNLDEHPEILDAFYEVLNETEEN